MITALSALFPAGYIVRVKPIAGELDEISLYDEVTGELADLCEPIGSTASLYLRGWTIDPTSGLLAAGVIVTFGTNIVEARYHRERPDIAAFYDNAELLRCGFEATISAGSAPSGPLEICVYSISADASEMAKIGSRIIQIRSNAHPLSISGERHVGFALVAVDGWFLGNHEVSGSTDAITIRRGTVVTLHGWAIDATIGAAVVGVALIVSDQDIVRGTIGEARADVAELHGGACRNSGFRVTFNTAALACGRHTLQIGVFALDGSYDIVPIKQFLQVRSTIAR